MHIYRPDIDGLRAIAVLSVIVFHINPSWLPGGFLGVDIFFVISGYLITLLLIKNVESTGQLELVGFYRRRVQRIIPALLVMISMTLVAGFVIMTPWDFLELVKSAIASVFSVANIFFYSQVDTGYFATQTEDIPLLHAWSLGVEEQYYLIWPFLVFILITSVHENKRRIYVLVMSVVVSLFIAEWLTRVDRSFSYYMLPTRAWELMAGGVVAFLHHSGYSFRYRVTENCMSVIGFLAVISSFVAVDEDSLVPGIAATPLVAGSALTIFATSNSIVSRVLSLKPLVLIGLVSYSAYLWHWPILAFMRYMLIEIDLASAMLIIGGTFFLAAITYFLVEQRFRRNNISDRRVFATYFAVPAVAFVVVLTVFSYLISSKNPAVYQWSKYEAAEATARQPLSYNFNCQFRNFSRENFVESRCVYPQGATEDAILIGDSNAAHYVGMLRVFAKSYGFTFRNFTQSACPLVFGEIDWINKKYAAGCQTYRDFVRSSLPTFRGKVVMVGGSWANYDLVGTDEFRQFLDETIAEIAEYARTVVLFAQAPIFPNYMQGCEMRKIRLPGISCSHSSKKVDYKVNDYLERLANKYENVHFFYMNDLLCTDDRCKPTLFGKPLYYNSGHMAIEGSVIIGEEMVRRRSAAAVALGKLITQSQ